MFDDLANPNRVLNGQYPSGFIDWGNYAWWLASPWGKLTTNSISFNGSGSTAASFSFLQPHLLLKLDAYNGGTSSSVVSLTCVGQPVRQVTLGPSQISTIQTGWTATCTSVSIASSNGWWTNFDNLVVQ